MKLLPTSLRLLLPLAIAFIAIVLASHSKKTSKNYEQGESSNSYRSLVPGVEKARSSGMCYEATIVLNLLMPTTKDVECKTVCGLLASLYLVIYELMRDSGTYAQFQCSKGEEHFFWQDNSLNLPINATQDKPDKGNLGFEDSITDMEERIAAFDPSRSAEDTIQSRLFTLASRIQPFSKEGSWLLYDMSSGSNSNNGRSNRRSHEEKELRNCMCSMTILFDKVAHVPGQEHLCDLFKFSKFITEIGAGWTLNVGKTYGIYGKGQPGYNIFGFPTGFHLTVFPPGPVERQGFTCSKGLDSGSWFNIASYNNLMTSLRPTPRPDETNDWSSDKPLEFM